MESTLRNVEILSVLTQKSTHSPSLHLCVKRTCLSWCLGGYTCLFALLLKSRKLRNNCIPDVVKIDSG